MTDPTVVVNIHASVYDAKDARRNFGIIVPVTEITMATYPLPIGMMLESESLGKVFANNDYVPQDLVTRVDALVAEGAYIHTIAVAAIDLARTGNGYDLVPEHLLEIRR